MDDDKIVELFWQRAESAIRETEKKYARYIKYIHRCLQPAFVSAGLSIYGSSGTSSIRKELITM